MEEDKTSHRLFVGGLFQGITDQDLKDRFSRFGDVTGVDIRARKDNLGNVLKTFAYLNMNISEKDFRKCMATFNKTKWRGNEMQIQKAKESFMDRLAREREASKTKESPEVCGRKSEDIPLQVKGAPPGTEIEGKKDWIVGKYGRALPIVHIRTQNKKKVVTVDPSKYVHGVKKFDHGKKANEVENENGTSVNTLTWQIEVEETETLKKIKGEYPLTTKSPSKRRHSTGNRLAEKSSSPETVEHNELAKVYHSNSESCDSSEEMKPVAEKKKKIDGKASVDLNGADVSSRPRTPPISESKRKRKRTISNTSTPCNENNRKSNVLSPDVSIIEPCHTNESTKTQTAMSILEQLRNVAKKKKVPEKKTVTSDASGVSASLNGRSDEVFKEYNVGQPKEKPIKVSLDTSSSSSLEGVDNKGKSKKSLEKSTKMNGKPQNLVPVQTSMHQQMAKDNSEKPQKSNDIDRKVLEDSSESFSCSKSKMKNRNTKSTPVSVKVIQFDTDIGIGCDEGDLKRKLPISRLEDSRLRQTAVQPSFALVGSVDEFGVGMLVDDKTAPITAEEMKWKKYNSGGFSSEEDVLDAAKAGRFTKLNRIAKVAELRQKHVEIPTSNSETVIPKVYNSDTDEEEGDNDRLMQIQKLPNHLSQKPMKNNTNETVQLKNDSHLENNSMTMQEHRKLKGNRRNSVKVDTKETAKPNIITEKLTDRDDMVTHSCVSQLTKQKPTIVTKLAADNVCVGSSSTTSSSDPESQPTVTSVKNKGCSSPSESSECTESSDSMDMEAEMALRKQKFRERRVSRKDTPVSKQQMELEFQRTSIPDKAHTITRITREEESTESSSESESEQNNQRQSVSKQQTELELQRTNVPDKAHTVTRITREEESTESSSESESEQNNQRQSVNKTKRIKIKKRELPESSSESSSDSLAEDTRTSRKSLIGTPPKCVLPNQNTSKTATQGQDVSKTGQEADKIKATKNFQDSNQLRLESLKQRSQEAWAQKNLLKQALASVDSGSIKSKKIVFDSESEEEKMKSEQSSSSSSSDSDSGNESDTESSDEETGHQQNKDGTADKSAKKRPTLFDESSEESKSETEDEDQFRIRPQYEGKAGSKLMSMQARFGNDPRFKFTEKFLDSEEEKESEEEVPSVEEDTNIDKATSERDRTLAILKDVVGQTGKLSKKSKPVLFKDMTMQQYDPTKDEHKQFEITVKKKEKKKKKEPEVVSEAQPVPEVSGERFFEVQTSLKDLFNQQEEKPFSLLSVLGQPDVGRSGQNKLQQEDGKGTLLSQVKSPWQQQFGSDQSSEDDQSDVENTPDETSMAKPEVDNTGEKGTKGPVSKGFFFVENDSRIADGIDFFRRQDDLAKIRETWSKERPELVEAYRNKRKRFRFMKRENKTPNYKAGFKQTNRKRNVRGRR